MNGSEYVKASDAVKAVMRRALRQFNHAISVRYGMETTIEEHLLASLMKDAREDLKALIEGTTT
jgi:hypothetical protein